MTEVIDFKTKRMLSKHRKKQKEKVKDVKFDADWVADELVKVINKSFDKKIDAFDISLALTDITMQFVHDFAPSTACGQHMLLTAMQEQMEQQLYEESNDE
jgi:ArsR family metal-binding transcriptional regulator